MDRKEIIRIIQNDLEALRNDPNRFLIFQSTLRQHFKENEIPYSDIGTSEEELRTLEVKNLRIRAGKNLEILRKVPTEPSIFLVPLRRILNEGGFSLADIGTNEDELRELEIKGLMKSARGYLKALRDDQIEHSIWIDRNRLNNLRRCVEEGGFTFADIDTDEDELKKLTSGRH